MEIEQMMARLPVEIKAEIRTNQAKTDVNLREMREEMTSGQELLTEELLAKLDVHHERMMASMDTQLEKMEFAVEDNQEEENDTDLETNAGEMESEAGHGEVSKEEDAVQMIGTLKEQYGDRHLDVWRRRQMKKRSQGDGETRKILAAASRQTSAMQERHGHTGQTVEQGQQKNWARDNVARGISKEPTSEKRLERNRNVTTA
jgi:hypothetical protein